MKPGQGSWRGTPHLAIVWRRMWLIALVSVGSVVSAIVFTLVQPVNYTASAVLHITTRATTGNDQVRPDDLLYVDRLENTYAKLTTSKPLVEELVKAARLPGPPSIDTRSVPNTELMEISVTTPNRASAASAANELAALLIARVRSLTITSSRGPEGHLMSQITNGQSRLTAKRRAYTSLAARSIPAGRKNAQLLELKQEISLTQSRLKKLQNELDGMQLAREERANSLSVIEPAVAATQSGRHLFRNPALALIIGLIAGTGLAYFAERIRPRLHGERDVKATADVPILTTVPYVRAPGDNPTFNHGSPAEEAIRRLRLSVFASRRPDDGRFALVITSPERGDGKTTIAANLGRLAAQAGDRVLLVDADRRRPALHAHFDRPGEAGFQHLLEGAAPASVTRTTDTPNLFVIPAESPPDGAGKLLEAADWSGLLDSLRAEFDVVLIDTPPVLDVSDALILAAPADGVLLVLRSSNVPRDVLEQAQEELEAVGAHVVGVVINRTGRYPKYAYS